VKTLVVLSYFEGSVGELIVYLLTNSKVKGSNPGAIDYFSSLVMALGLGLRHQFGLVR
jgi:hypothetical protein